MGLARRMEYRVRTPYSTEKRADLPPWDCHAGKCMTHTCAAWGGIRLTTTSNELVTIIFCLSQAVESCQSMGWAWHS